jgi:hypothetical protein
VGEIRLDLYRTLGATQDVDLGAWALNAFSVKINGTNGNGHINLRHQASNATARGQSSTIFLLTIAVI